MSVKKVKILLVDDEDDILDFLKYNLEKEGYKIYTAHNGQEGLKLAAEHIPNLILLDIMMPVMNGIEACYEIRKMPELNQTMIAFLTARSDEFTEVNALNAGADDFISKPIKPKVLLAKISAILRRESSQPLPQHASPITIKKDSYLVVYKNKELRFPKKEFELLELLMSQPGKVFLREDIMQQIWGEDVIVGDRTIDVHIRKLREKLDGDIIETVKGIGYKINIHSPE